MVKDIERSVVVNGQTGQFQATGVRHIGTGNTHNGHPLQLSGNLVYAVDGAVRSQGVQGLICITVGHVQDLRCGIGIIADVLGLAPGIVGGYIEVPILSCHKDVPIGILGCGHDQIRLVQICRTAVGGGVAIPHRLRVDFHPALALSPHAAPGVAVHLAGKIFCFAGVLYQIGGLIFGVVAHHHVALRTHRNPRQIQGGVGPLSSLGLFRCSGGIELAPGALHLNGGHIVVISGLYNQVTGVQVLIDIQNLRRCVIHLHGGTQGYATAQNAAVHQIPQLGSVYVALRLIQLWDGHTGDGDLVPLLHIESGDLFIHTAAASLLKERTGTRAKSLRILVVHWAHIQAFIILIGNDCGNGGGIANERPALHKNGGFAADCRSTFRIGLLHTVGIHSILILHPITIILQAHIVGTFLMVIHRGGISSI